MSRHIEIQLDTFQLIWSLWLTGDSSEDDILRRVLKSLSSRDVSPASQERETDSTELKDGDLDEEEKKNGLIDIISPTSSSAGMFGKIRWVDDVVEALSRLNGEADLSQIYQKVQELRKQSNRPIVTSLKATIRQTIEAHSSDSESFQHRRDLFKHVGRGRWRLR